MALYHSHTLLSLNMLKYRKKKLILQNKEVGFNPSMGFNPATYGS